MTTEEILAERGKTHGSFADNARVMQSIKAIFRYEPGWNRLSAVHREVLDMLALKIGRVLTGDPEEPDHFDDIAGYATLAAKDIRSRIEPT